jgi:uncharacterized membrane protein
MDQESPPRRLDLVAQLRERPAAGTLNFASLLDIGLAASIVVAAAAALAAIYGRYRVLPRVFTGPNVCRLEAGGCEVLFRTPAAAVLRVPNAALGLVLYLLLALGLALDWPNLPLLGGATLALAMSVYLAWYLIRNRLECRVCWTGHFANLALWMMLLIRELAPSG